ncbi:MAG: caspase family protein [Kofleriaceae bacterium]
MLSRLAFAACLLASAPAFADYAIVVGSNSGGPGQVDLHYAEDDARRVAAVLTDLGGYTTDQVDVLVHPTPDQLRDHLAKLAERVQADVTAGHQARVFFYYSGHARAQAIDLGSTELPLEELRAKLFKIPAALTVVVLDACQSGAFSRIKGAAPAADFSFSSRQHLDATGIAVLASSTGSELSQESEQLKSSYFTYHFLVGLRGAGDANNDGEVSVDEAYRYAYHQTLLATAETAVGGQHVTFEADLKGHGEVPLSYPRAATAQITLPARIEGKTLVEDRRSHTVVAETYKAKGAAVRIAVAPGDYDVLVRHGSTLSRCTMTAPGEIDLDRCHDEPFVEQRAKGGDDDDDDVIVYETRFEIGGFLGGSRQQDDYTKNLQTFGYSAQAPLSAGLTAAGVTTLRHGLVLGGRLTWEQEPDWRHDIVGGSGASQRLAMNTTTVELIARYPLPQLSPRLRSYTELGAGLAIGRTHLTSTDTMADTMRYDDTNFGPSASGALAFEVRLGNIGLVARAGYELAFAIKDLIGNTHLSGGARGELGVTYGF